MRRRLLTVALAIGLLSGCAQQTGTAVAASTTSTATASTAPASAAVPVLTVSPRGDGDCTKPRPCRLATALKRVVDGGVIELRSGRYGSVRLNPDPRFGTFAQGVVVRPATKAKPVLRRLYTAIANVTWRGLEVRGVVYLKPQATGTTLHRLRVDGGGVFIRSDGARLVRNVIQNGASMDGVQIGGVRDVQLLANTIRDFTQDGSTGYHADCVQIYDSSDVRIERNSLANCYNASIIFSGGAGKGVSNVLVEGNFVSGCRVKGPSCAYGTVLDLREKSVRDVVVRNNTFLGGSARVEPLPGMVLDRNVFAYLSSCASPITNSIVAEWNRGLCGTYPAIGTVGNRLGTVAVRSIEANDLTPRRPASVRITPSGAPGPGITAFDGTRLPPNVAGAQG